VAMLLASRFCRAFADSSIGTKPVTASAPLREADLETVENSRERGVNRRLRQRGDGQWTADPGYHTTGLYEDEQGEASAPTCLRRGQGPGATPASLSRVTTMLRSAARG
jgi:hypothetical protein